MGKSPKGKGSNGKSNSPGSKGSKGKNVPEEPPVERGMQTDSGGFCYLCCVDFSDGAAIQAHTLLMDHRPPYDISHQHCRGCKDTVFMKWTEKHKCALAKAAYLRHVSSNVSLPGGPPYRCLFCRSRPFSSRIELTVHLLVYHRPARQPGALESRRTYDPVPELLNEDFSAEAIAAMLAAQTGGDDNSKSSKSKSGKDKSKGKDKSSSKKKK
ncbi:unnamed protein product [Dibothriocephalus latus]|uniref:C2H2-type domain-containing protein n=1 Tax=Dibothriocephalus latus TaxID=60516 RepID=A0A3P6VBI9_DIBLA|nr:unnamed protein product [Dibothriocephalus latus]